MWSQETWLGIVLFAAAVAALFAAVWGVGLHILRKDDERLRRKALLASWPVELEQTGYEDAYKGPRQERGAQRRILGGFR